MDCGRSCVFVCIVNCGCWLLVMACSCTSHIACMIMFVKKTGFSCIAYMFMYLLDLDFHVSKRKRDCRDGGKQGWWLCPTCDSRLQCSVKYSLCVKEL